MRLPRSRTLPKELILLAGSLPKRDEVLFEAEAHGYGDLFFDVTLDPLAWCHECGTEITTLDVSDVNAEATFLAVQRSTLEKVIFSASGILGKRMLSSGKHFIHSHPGLLPDYRGSTCFYYSLLERGEVASTAFFLNEGIDTGQIIWSSRFSLHYRVTRSQQMFMDHILDPFIRALTLKRVLATLRAGLPLNTRANPLTGQPVCYVMHPLLRMLAIQSMNKRFDPGRPLGLFEIQG